MTLPEGWSSQTLAHFIELQRGFDLPYRSRRPGVYKVLSSGEAHGWHDEAKVTGPGFVVGRATNIGRPTWSDEDFWPLNTTLFAKDFKGNDPKFAYYWFVGNDLTAYNSGSVQPMLNRNYIANIPIQVPPVHEQRAIAATLGALDDKIESNLRAVNIIQRISSVLFVHWRNEAPVAETSTFGAYADIYGGATPKTKVAEYWGGDLAWATPTDVTRLEAPYLFDTSRTITTEGLQSCNAAMHPAGTIFMTSRATIGAFAINQVPTATNQGFIAVRPKQEVDRYFLFEEMRSRVDEFLDNANGSTFLEISRGRFKDLSIVIPRTEAIVQIDQRLKPLHVKATQLVEETNRLSRLRGSLLPELLSGRIRVLVDGGSV